MPHDDWTKPKFSTGGVFLKGPKVNCTEQVIRRSEKLKFPAPNQYFKDLKAKPEKPN